MINDIFSDRLTKAIKKIGAPICLGLDPHPNLIPRIFLHNKKVTINSIEEFVLDIVTIAKDRVAAIKPQVAFFEQYGSEGMSLLVKASRLAQDMGLIVIMDAKRGDIGSTSKAYANAWLGKDAPFPSDAITVNPWMGIDTLEPFVEKSIQTNSGLFILLKTSNPGSSELQNILIKNEPLFVHLAKLLKPLVEKTCGRFGYSSIGVVVGATNPIEALKIRKILPKSLFLIPGYGAQGASFLDATSGLLKINNCFEGGLVNSSRELIFPKKAFNSESKKKWKKEVINSIDVITKKFKL